MLSGTTAGQSWSNTALVKVSPCLTYLVEHSYITVAKHHQETVPVSSNLLRQPVEAR
jgi:hypothetical protein